MTPRTDERLAAALGSLSGVSTDTGSNARPLGDAGRAGGGPGKLSDACCFRSFGSVAKLTTCLPSGAYSGCRRTVVMSEQSTSAKAIRFRGGSILPTCSRRSRRATLINQAPGYFVDKRVILDLSAVTLSAPSAASIELLTISKRDCAASPYKPGGDVMFIAPLN
jgi:hypothetical protein